jgi:NADH-quinone oxidoreductase subunit C
MLKILLNLTLVIKRLSTLNIYIANKLMGTFLNVSVLVDHTAIDLLQITCRFRLVYVFLSYFLNLRFLCLIKIREFQKINSLNLIFLSVNWLEREVFDMFGIFYKNHPDLRRILTDYGFKGYPLRRDFPLIGFKEIFFDEFTSKIIYRTI